MKSSAVGFVLSLVLITLIGCGDSGLVNPNYKWKGAAGNLSVSDLSGWDKDGRIERFGVGFDSSTSFADILALLPQTANQDIPIGGVVVPSSSSEAGFYLDPSTTKTSGALAPEWIVSVDQVKANLQKYATTAADSGIPTGFWYVMVHVEGVQ
jgi:hypothetical protein